MNALAAFAAAAAIGVDARALLPALAGFDSVKRRMELVAEVEGVRIFDDFAHHPTAIATTLAGLRASVGSGRILVALEPRSNSMRQGAHADGAGAVAGRCRPVVLCCSARAALGCASRHRRTGRPRRHRRRRSRR